MKNLIIVKHENNGYHGLNSLHSGTLNLNKEEGGKMGKHMNLKDHQAFFSMLQGD